MMRSSFSLFLVAVFSTCFAARISVADPFRSIEVFGVDWLASSRELPTDDLGTTKLIVLRMPDGFAFRDVDHVAQFYLAACPQILPHVEELGYTAPEGSDLDFIHVSVEAEDEKMFPYPFSHRLDGGECTGTLSFQMPTLTDAFSAHSGNDEFLSVLNSWGTGLPELTFLTGNKGKVIGVEIALIKGFERAVESLNATALCIHALANLETVVDKFPLKTRPENFSRIDIEIINRVFDSAANVRRVVGAASFGLKGGQCVSLEDVR